MDNKLATWICYHYTSEWPKERTFSLFSGVRQRVSYEQHLKQLFNQARNCVYIQHKGVVQDVLKACVKHGEVHRAFTVNKEEKQFILVQFKKESSVLQLMGDAEQFPDRRESIPIESRHMYFTNPNSHRRKKLEKLSRKDFSTIRVISHAPVRYEDSELQHSSSLSAQMETLYKKLSQRESDILLKMFLCVSLEDTLKKILPSCQARPFGSFISGFGRHDSDVDLCIDVYGNSDEKVGSLKESSLYFLTKRKLESDRNNVKNALDTIAGILQCFMPGYYNVNRILHARVPIIKLQHSGLQLDCDITLDRTGAVMSELLYNIGQLNPAVCPLVFTVRHWARQCEVTRKAPGPWLSNYMLTMLVVYFLQNRPVPVLPPLQKLLTLKDGGEDDQQVEFHSLNSVLWDHQNTESLGDLLIAFFNFYGSLDFAHEGISVLEGTTVIKPVDDCALYMENPINPVHNICKNVSDEELERFTNVCRTSSSLLQGCEKNKSDSKWGLLRVLSVDCGAKIENGFEKKISVTMDQLFKDDSDGSIESDSIKKAVTEL